MKGSNNFTLKFIVVLTKNNFIKFIDIDLSSEIY